LSGTNGTTGSPTHTFHDQLSGEEQFAQKLGVTYSTVNHWENGKRVPQPFLLRRLLEMKDEIAVMAADGGSHQFNHKHRGTHRRMKATSDESWQGPRA